MHIVILDMDDIRNPLLGAGQARATVEVGKRLVAMGHDITVMCSGYPGAKDRIEHGITYRHIGSFTTNVKLNNVVYLFAVLWAVRNVRADIILECFTSPASTLMSPLCTSIPVVALPTSFAADRHSKLYHLPFTVIERLGARTYKYFLPYTKAYLDKMRSYNPHIHARIVPEGVDQSFFALKLKKPEYILYLGRIDIDQKGIDILLDAYAALPQKTYPLVIAGKGVDEKRMLAKIQALHLDQFVQFVGPAFDEKKNKLLSKALFVVMPSRNEGFSLFSLEALASGLPLIVFDIPGFSWAKSRAVIKVKPFSVPLFTKALQRMMKKSVYVAARKAARPTAKPFTWDHVASEFATYFAYVLQKEKQI